MAMQESWASYERKLMSLGVAITDLPSVPSCQYPERQWQKHYHFKIIEKDGARSDVQQRLSRRACPGVGKCWACDGHRHNEVLGGRSQQHPKWKRNR